jgi:hypothetical protein
MIKHLSLSHYLLMLLLATVWILFQSRFEISADSTLYINQAHLFSINEVRSAIDLYNWPFYSYSISFIHRLLSLSIIDSARVINAFFFLISCLYFLKILLIITERDKVIFSGFIIIITSIPLMDDYLSMMLRDCGSWAGFLAGIYYFMRWVKHNLLIDCGLWQLSFLIGFLFRIELFIFLIILPFVSVYIIKDSLKSYVVLLYSYSLLIILLLTSIIFYFGNFLPDISFNSPLVRFQQLLSKPLVTLNELFKPLPIYTDNFDLKIQLEDYSVAVKYSILSTIIILSWLSTIKIFHLLTGLITLKFSLILSKFNLTLLIILIISFLIPTFFEFTSFDVSGRYWIFSIWVFYIYSAIGLDYCFNNIDKYGFKKGKLLLFFLWATIIIYMATVLFDSSIKSYSQSILWVRSNGIHVNEIYTNDLRINAFIKGQNYPYKEKDIKYLVINNVSHHEYLSSREYQNFLNTKNLKLLKKIPNDSKPDFSIFVLEDKP